MGDLTAEETLRMLNEIEIDELVILEYCHELGMFEMPSNHFLKEQFLFYKQYIDSLQMDEFRSLLERWNFPIMEKEQAAEYYAEFVNGLYQKKRTNFLMKLDLFRNKSIKSAWTRVLADDYSRKNYYKNDLCAALDGGAIYFHIGKRIRIFESNFSLNLEFEKSLPPVMRTFFHDYFTRLLRHFKSDFILYANEAANIPFDLEDESQQISSEDKEVCRQLSSPTIHTMGSIDTMGAVYYVDI